MVHTSKRHSRTEGDEPNRSEPIRSNPRYKYKAEQVGRILREVIRDEQEGDGADRVDHIELTGNDQRRLK